EEEEIKARLEEEEIKARLEEEKEIKARLEEARQKLDEELKAQQKIEEEKDRLQLRTEEEELKGQQQMIEGEEHPYKHMEELKGQQRTEEEELKGQQQIIEEEEHPYKHMEELKEQQLRIGSDDNNLISVGIKRQHCLDDILNDAHEVKRVSKKARTQDYYSDDNLLVTSANNCSDENSFSVNENIDFPSNKEIDRRGIYISQNDDDKPLEQEITNDNQHNHSMNNSLDKSINSISTCSNINKGEENSLESKSENYITEIQGSRMPFDPVRDAQNVDMNQDMVYSYTTPNTMPDDENTYNQHPLYSRPAETLEVNNNAETLVNEAIQPEECHIEQIAGSHLNLLMQAVGLLEAGVSSLPEDL
ncbi:8397_t:CDS:2, partial [Scutellospora calospora]